MMSKAPKDAEHSSPAATATPNIDIDIDDARRRLMSAHSSTVFDPSELDTQPEPIRRYFNASIAPGAAVATVASLRMRGHIKVRRWLPFRADQVLAPHSGFVWRARAAAVISGSDAYVDGQGAMRWKILGLASVMRADGPDISKSGAGRCGGEGMWLPTALLPRFGVRWSAPADDHIVATFAVDTTPLEVHFRIDGSGQVTSIVFDRWGDPDETGTFGWHPFGGEITDHQSFNGLTVPNAGNYGWFYGTDRWQDGEFFRCRITHHDAPGTSRDPGATA
jgi:hypothetical protein